MEILKRLDVSSFFLSFNHAAKAAAIASVTGSVRLTGSPSTPATATPRISLKKEGEEEENNPDNLIPDKIKCNALNREESRKGDYSSTLSQHSQYIYLTRRILNIVLAKHTCHFEASKNQLSLKLVQQQQMEQLQNKFRHDDLAG